MEESSNKQLWFKTLPNQLSLFRVAVVPGILLLYPTGFRALELFCAFLFLCACITDWADGFVARRFGLESKFGALLDPIADKMLTGAGLILITQSQAVWAWMAGILICREMGISGLRLIALQNNISIEVNGFGKVKTFFMDSAIFCLMINEPLWNLPFRAVGMISIWLTLWLSFYSAWLYLKEFMQKANI